MEIIYLLIPLSLVLIALIVWAFLWAVQSGQFDDLEGPAHEILMDDDTPRQHHLSEDNEVRPPAGKTMETIPNPRMPDA
ncbi:MAG: cbb3-type cytochrome oxidase assembly protein CcoS [Gammaproteobacteria bacterium]|nr:cbb3-type cytochrome oxidase assembly protein CcoS [Gammaproteobacteria bacterium]